MMTLSAVTGVVAIEVDPIKAYAACDSFRFHFKGYAGYLCYAMTQMPLIAM